MQKIEVSESGERLDVYLARQLNITRSATKNLIDSKKILVDGKVKKAGYIIKSGDVIFVEDYKKPQLSAKAQDIPLDIVFEDDDLLVINKPQGMCVHPSAGHYDGTLVNALVNYTQSLSDINGDFRPGIVHRLDKDTSGLMLVAKNDKSHVELARQIKTKECKRHYMAVLEGNLRQDSGEVTTNIARSKKNRQKMDVCDSTRGKLAITKFWVVQRLQGYTLVHFELLTGRTHQIRVHAKYLGHAVVGDKVYGTNACKEKGIDGQLLTAYKICFEHPTTKKHMEFEVPLPTYMTNFVKKHS